LTRSCLSIRVRFQTETLPKFGFYPVSQSGTSPTTTGPGVGSILMLGVLAFGLRNTTSSTISVLFRRESPAAAVAVQTSEPSITDQIRALGELHDAGLVTTEEFNTKKAQLLDRL
jgi:Short C-terminal domain